MPVADVALDDVLARCIDGHDRTRTTAWQPSLGPMEAPMHECPHCGCSAATRNSDQLLTVNEARAILGVSRTTIYQWIRGNDVPFVRMPSGRIRFSEDALNRWIKSRSRRGRR